MAIDKKYIYIYIYIYTDDCIGKKLSVHVLSNMSILI